MYKWLPVLYGNKSAQHNTALHSIAPGIAAQYCICCSRLQHNRVGWAKELTCCVDSGQRLHKLCFFRYLLVMYNPRYSCIVLVPTLCPCRFLPSVQGSVRIYLQQYTDWASSKQHPTLPATAVGAPTHQSPVAPAARGATISTLQASQLQHDQVTAAAAAAARVPFAALSKPKPLAKTSGKAVSKAGLRPPSQVAASLDQENAAGTQALAAGKHVYSMGQFGVGGVAQRSMHPFGEGRQGKLAGVGASMSPMHMR